jgi:hypothetical protein
VITNGIMVISAPEPRVNAPSSLQQNAPLPAAYLPMTFPPASSLYTTSPQPLDAIVTATVRVPLFPGAIPNNIVAGDSGELPDCVHEGYNLVLLTFTLVFSVFFTIFLVAALVTARDEGNVSANNPLVLIMAGWWLLCSVFYAYDCKRFDCRIYRGVRIESEERRLLTALFTSSRSSISWDVLFREEADVEVSERTPMSFCLMGMCWSCFCSPPRWAVIVLKERRGSGSRRQRQKPNDNNNGVRFARDSDSDAPATVLLARCLPGLVDVDLRKWISYLDAVSSSAAARGLARQRSHEAEVVDSEL